MAEVDELLQAADQGVYSAKRNGALATDEICKGYIFYGFRPQFGQCVGVVIDIIGADTTLIFVT